MAKAAHYFGLTVKHVPVGPDFRADVREMEKVGWLSVACVCKDLTFKHVPVGPYFKDDVRGMETVGWF